MKSNSTLSCSFYRLAGRALLFASAIAILAPHARGSDIYFHQVLTKQVLLERGWTDRQAVADVLHANVAADIAHRNALARAGIGIVLPSAESRVPWVNDLAASAGFSDHSTVGFHFNSRFRFDDISARWADFGDWVDETARRQAQLGAPEEARRAFLGLVAHHVQDYYAHANWVEIIEQFSDVDPVPTWEQLMENQDHWLDTHPTFPAAAVRNRMRASNAWISSHEHTGGLQTGRLLAERVPGANPWRHRHHHSGRMDRIHQVAALAMHAWFDRVERGWDTTLGTAATAD